MGTSFAVMVLILHMATGDLRVVEIPFAPADGYAALSVCENADVVMPPDVLTYERACFVNPGYSM